MRSVQYDVIFLSPWCNSPQYASAISSRLYDRIQLDPQHSVGLLWTSDRPDTKTST